MSTTRVIIKPRNLLPLKMHFMLWFALLLSNAVVLGGQANPRGTISNPDNNFGFSADTSLKINGNLHRWMAADDDKPGAARIRLFFHFVKSIEDKTNLPDTKECARMMVEGQELPIPGRPSLFFGGARFHFAGTGIRFDIVGTDVVRVSQRVVDAGDCPAMASRNKRTDCINVYVVPRVADDRGDFGGVCLTSQKSVFVKWDIQPGFAPGSAPPHEVGQNLGVAQTFTGWRGTALAHELGHFLGLAHTKKEGIMFGLTPPFVTLTDNPVAGDFAPSQIKIMQSHLPRFAMNSPRP